MQWVITGYGFSQIYFHMCYKSWWTQNAIGYYRLWVITVLVISGLTVFVNILLTLKTIWQSFFMMKNLQIFIFLFDTVCQISNLYCLQWLCVAFIWQSLCQINNSIMKYHITQSTQDQQHNLILRQFLNFIKLSTNVTEMKAQISNSTEPSTLRQ